MPGMDGYRTVVAIVVHPSHRPLNVGRRRYRGREGDLAESLVLQEAVIASGFPRASEPRIAVPIDVRRSMAVLLRPGPALPIGGSVPAGGGSGVVLRGWLPRFRRTRIQWDVQWLKMSTLNSMAAHLHGHATSTLAVPKIVTGGPIRTPRPSRYHADLLNAVLVHKHAEGIAAKLDFHDRMRFLSVLCFMGAQDTDLSGPVFRDVLAFERSKAARHERHGVACAPDVSPLKCLGYGVGRCAPGDATTEILRTAFEGELPETGYPLDAWGTPGSRRRFLKICTNLCNYSSNEERKERYSRQAIEEWDADLAWFREWYERQL